MPLVFVLATLSLIALPIVAEHVLEPAPIFISSCDHGPSTLHLSQPLYENYFYSDCHSASQVVVTSPLPDSDLSLIGPRLLVAWPAGTSGLATFFSPQSGINGSLVISLANESASFPVQGISCAEASNSDKPMVGVGGLINFNSSAILNLSILGSVRNIRDFTESGSVLTPAVQDGLRYPHQDDGSVLISRTWLDNVTTTNLSFKAVGKECTPPTIFQHGNESTVAFSAGTHLFTTTFNYPQLIQLNSSAALSPSSQSLITQQPDTTISLSFLSYSDKLLAGAWRFLTYFGRDSMIFLLLAQPVLSNEAIDAVISAVLERINGTTGAVCHEETIGDYATYQNMQKGLYSTGPSCSYVMIDTDYYLPVVLKNYYDVAPGRVTALLNRTATTAFGNAGISYAALAQLNAERIMNTSALFASEGNQTRENLRHLLPDQQVGQWRDSTYGIGGGRIPLDVNTALVPAALRAIASLSSAGFWQEDHPDWADAAASYAEVWEDNTLPFFEITEPVATAKNLVSSYASSNFTGPSNVGAISSNITYYALALDGNNNQSTVKVMNSDACFRLFLLNSTDAAQTSRLLRATAQSVIDTFPVGLMTDTGLLVANPAYGGDPVYAANWTTSAYHGTVVWGWPMAMMASGLERQLARCSEEAYNTLWDVIEANLAHLTSELWSWRYANGTFEYVNYGSLSATESDVRQLWSLSYLAVTRDESLR